MEKIQRSSVDKAAEPAVYISINRIVRNGLVPASEDTVEKSHNKKNPSFLYFLHGQPFLKHFDIVGSSTPVWKTHRMVYVFRDTEDAKSCHLLMFSVTRSPKHCHHPILLHKRSARLLFSAARREFLLVKLCVLFEKPRYISRICT